MNSSLLTRCLRGLALSILAWLAFAPSVATALTATTTTVASAANPGYVGYKTRLMATVTGTSPTGTVTFKDGTATLGTATVSGGSAVFYATFASTGSHRLTAVYGGDSVNASSTSAALTETINTTPAVWAYVAAESASFSTTSAKIVRFGRGSNWVQRTVSGTGQCTVAFFGLDPVVGTVKECDVTSTLAASSVALTSSINPSTTAQATSLTATVTPTSATGTITFRDGTTVLGTATLASGIARLNQTFSSTGTHSLTAVYSGSTTLAASISGTITQTVNAASTATTTSLGANPSTVYVGQSAVLTATTTPAAATGSVTFKDGATVLGTANLASGVATFSATFSSAGAHSLTATYAGNGTYATSTSTAVNETVNAKVATSTTLASSVNPASVGQSTTLTATVTGSSPAGTVTFLDGATTLGTGTLSGGVATLAVTFPSSGAHSLTAAYGGNVANNVSTSGALAQTVNAASTGTVLTASANPTTIAQSTTLTATVTPSNATGTVTFNDGATTLGTGTLSGGIATLATSFTLTGTHNLTATYSGSANYATSSSAVLAEVVSGATGSWGTIAFEGDGFTVTGGQIVRYGSGTSFVQRQISGAATCSTAFFGSDPAIGVPKSCQVLTGATSTSTGLASSINPSSVGQAASLTATVTPAAATGTVLFRDGATTLGTATVSAGIATLSTTFASAGLHNITAIFSGNSTYASSTSAAVAQNVTTASTSLTLASTFNPATTAQQTTLTATVTPSSATGTVAFKDGAATIGTAAVSGGVATLNFTFGVAGSHSLTATYSGDAAFAASTSTALLETVNTALSVTTTSLSATPSPGYLNQPVQLTATVAPAAATGTVTFTDGVNTLGTGTVSGGIATITTSFANLGTWTLVASYSGSATHAASTSAVLYEGVATPPQASSIDLAVTPDPATINQPVYLTAYILPETARGQVVFKDGAVVLGTSNIAQGIINAYAELAITLNTNGVHSLTAQYLGSPTYAASTSLAKLVTVNGKVASSTALALSANPPAVGQSTTITATVAGSSPTGTVTITDGSTVLGTLTLSGGSATLNTVFAMAGTHTLVAAYGGDATNDPSTSTVTAQVNGVAGALPQAPASPAPVANFEYDAKGNPTRIIRAPGVAGFGFPTSSSYDNLDRRKDTTDARAGRTQFDHDGQDRLLQVTDPRLLVTQSPRNGLGDQKQLISPDTGTTNFNTYDAAGNVKTRTDARSVLATYSYDALNRVVGVVYSKAGQTSQSYGWNYDETGAGFSNGIGRLTSTTHPAGSTQHAYDPLGRLVTDTQRVNPAAGANAAVVTNVVSYGYDAAGRVTSLTYPSGAVLGISYVGGLASAMTLSKAGAATATNLITQIQWDAFGSPKGWMWQLGSATQPYSRQFDLSGRLVRYQLGTLVRDVAYDDADRIKSYTHYDTATAAAAAGSDQVFGYDELGRLTSVVAGASSWSIGYDANGNRTGVTLNGSASIYTTAATSNQLTAITNPARTFSYADGVGNITSDTGLGYSAAYDLTNRMATLTKSGVTTTYSVDGFGRRVRKFSSTGAASTIIFVYDQHGQLLGEYDGNGAAVREYVWLGNLPVAVLKPDPAGVSNPPLVYYIHADHLNAPRAVVDTGGKLRWKWLAEPFGTTAPDADPQALGMFTFNLRFPGQVYDQETGLVYNWNRYLDFTSGRYTSFDPIGLAGGVNGFAYVENNPLSYVDPLGLAVYRSGNSYTDRPTPGRDWEIARTVGDSIVGWNPADWGTVQNDGGSCPVSSGTGNGNWGLPMPPPVSSNSSPPSDMPPTSERLRNAPANCRQFLNACYVGAGVSGLATSGATNQLVTKLLPFPAKLAGTVAGGIVGGVIGQDLSVACNRAFHACVANQKNP